MAAVWLDYLAAVTVSYGYSETIKAGLLKNTTFMHTDTTIVSYINAANVFMQSLQNEPVKLSRLMSEEVRCDLQE